MLNYSQTFLSSKFINILYIKIKNSEKSKSMLGNMTDKAKKWNDGYVPWDD